MADYKGIDLLDYLVLIVKWKKLLIFSGIIIIVLTYLTIYFLVPPQYDSTSLIVASEDSNLNLAGALSESIKNIPLSALGFANISSSEKYDLFTTLIYSRSNLEKLINKFNLKNDYGISNRKKLIRAVKDNISAEVTEENAFEVTVRASSPEKSASMTNYIVQEVNKDVIELNTKKSRENRIFLEERYSSIKDNLATAEDSLRIFQKKAGVFDAENQVKSSIEAYTDLEGRLAAKEIELSIYKKLFGKNSMQYKTSEIAVKEFKDKLEAIKNGKENNLIMSINTLPGNALKYLRYYRVVKINEAMLEFIIPIYEQARYNEIKDIPVLQVIDKAVPPEKKSYPPRVLFSLIITVFFLLIISIYLFIKENLQNTTNPKVEFIRAEAFKFKNKK